MTEIRFYHLTRRPLEHALPGIVAKALERGHKLVIRARDDREAEFLCEKLWTFDPNGFLPHGTKKDGHPELQPVWLTAGTDNPNGADLLVIAGNAPDEDFERYGLCLHMFDGNSDAALGEARGRWKKYRDAGYSITYWQQTEQGWTQKA